MRYKYRCTHPMLPTGAKSPVMDNQQMEQWLNQMDNEGWEFVGYAQKHWHSMDTEPFIQDWWIFRMEIS